MGRIAPIIHGLTRCCDTVVGPHRTIINPLPRSYEMLDRNGFVVEGDRFRGKLSTTHEEQPSWVCISGSQTLERRAAMDFESSNPQKPWRRSIFDRCRNGELSTLKVQKRS